MKEIGGYFELQLPETGSFYPNLMALNSGRSCLEYILITEGCSKLFLPWYICDVVLEPIHKLGIEVEYYLINEDFKIKKPIVLKKSELLLYVNYFGLMDDYIRALSDKYPNLIIDNAQAFFSNPVNNIITYYSPRKFFGVADGGYLATKKTVKTELDQDISHPNSNYLLTRMDTSAQAGYEGFRKNEDHFSSSGLKTMSNLTETILASIDYENIKQKREDNFRFVDRELRTMNKIKIIPDEINGPMAYPLIVEKPGLREFLVSQKIFIAKYWDNKNITCPKDSFEERLPDQLVALPIDQRYGQPEMNFIINLVKSYCK